MLVNELADEDEIVLRDDSVSIAQRLVHAVHDSAEDFRTQALWGAVNSSPNGAVGGV